MLRIIVLLVISAAIIFGLSWAFDNDAGLEFEWLGYRIKTSLMVLFIAVIILILLLFVAYKIISWIISIPLRAKQKAKVKNYQLALKSVENSLVDIYSGDYKSAKRNIKKLTKQNGKISQNSAVPIILLAQLASNNGDIATALECYQKLSENKPTKTIGYKGLAINFQAKGDNLKALENAKKLHNHSPNSEGAASALLDLYKQNGKWEEARKFIEKNNSKEIDLAAEKTIIYSVLSDIARKKKDYNRATHLINLSQKSGGFLASYHIASDVYARVKRQKNSINAIASAWKNTPNIYLAEKMLAAIAKLKPKQKLKEIQSLISINPASLYSEYLLAYGYLAANEISDAKKHANIVKHNAVADFSAKHILQLQIDVLRAEGKNSGLIEAEKLESDLLDLNVQNGYLDVSNGIFHKNLNPDNYKLINELQWVENYIAPSNELKIV